MSTISELIPVKSERIIDLVSLAGVDISDWANFKGGLSKAATNPKYCYEWSFLEPGKVVVINLWHKLLKEHDGLILQSLNMRKRAMNTPVSLSESVWARRAKRFDIAVQTAYLEGLPVRVVICDGEMRDQQNASAKASRVKKRLLDPIPWAVTAYDFTTGEFTVIRGKKPIIFVDQFSINNLVTTSPEKRNSTVEVFARSREVRTSVLQRAQGKCEWCQEPGFQTFDGRVFLETHHIVPLSEGGADTERNVVALCPNHHREAHYGSNRSQMCRKLLSRLA